MADPIAGGYIAAPRSAVRAISVDGEAVLLDEHTNRLVMLNATGASLWVCFDGVATIGEICADVSDVLGA